MINNKDTFSDRLSLFLFHFAFILKEFKNQENDKTLQELYDFNFRQLELSIREIGYGDQSVNKKMKLYINLFHGILDKIHNWDEKSFEDKRLFFKEFINNVDNEEYLINYFDLYASNLSKKSLNF